MTGEKCVYTLFRRADIINCIIDDKLEVLVQQSVYQRGVGYTLSICQKRTNVQFSAFIAIITVKKDFLTDCPNKHKIETKIA